MPAEVQKAIDLILINFKNTYAYLDEILIIAKGSIDLHRDTLQKKVSKDWTKKISRYHWINVISHANKLNGLSFTLIAKAQQL